MCGSVKSNLTYGASVRHENAVTYSEGHEGQNICGIFSETSPLQRYSTYSVHRHTYSLPFFFRGCERVGRVVEPRVYTVVLFITRARSTTGTSLKLQTVLVLLVVLIR